MDNTVSTHKPGRLLAVGATAELYEWEPGWVLKLFFERYGKGFVEFEQRIAAAVCATGLPVPAVGGIVTHNGRSGLLYQRIEGVQMGDDLGKRPWLMLSHARMLAELHARMHAQPIQAELPSMHTRLEQKIREAKPLPERLRRLALNRLAGLPTGDRLCHGDFHPGNIILRQPQPVIIDWIDASIGSPLADVARTSILAQGWVATDPHFSRLQRLALRLLHATYLRRYFQLHPAGWDEYRLWLPVVAAGRLSEGVPGWEDWLLAQAGKLD